MGGDKISLSDKDFNSDDYENSVLLFWDTQLGKKTVHQLPEHQIYYYYVVSPDKGKLAFTEGKTLSMSSDVIVLDYHGEETGKFALPDDWNLFDWLNNDTLLIRQTRLQKDKNELVAVNPANGEQQVLPANFPNLYSRETLVVWGALTIFDPTASLVVYPERNGNEITSVVWDVDNKKEIASITGVSKWPRWASQGSKLLIVVDNRSTSTDVGHEEIFLAKPDGEVTRSTFFKEHFEHNILNLPVWSPNGRHVAFWLSTNVPIEIARLAVLDTETLTVDLYCNEVNPFPYRMAEHNTLGYSYYQVNAAPPIWSPDSQYLLVENYQDFTSNTYLFDLKNHAITQIAEGARPVGWMK
ncbi:MAG: hypothetical protein QY328_09610 [Anaerolineales bacterium]|nr:MAG: hypothetical protein QY328_09610 [Anaerolineales bacterium]